MGSGGFSPSRPAKYQVTNPKTMNDPSKPSFTSVRITRSFEMNHRADARGVTAHLRVTASPSCYEMEPRRQDFLRG